MLEALYDMQDIIKEEKASLKKSLYNSILNMTQRSSSSVLKVVKSTASLGLDDERERSLLIRIDNLVQQNKDFESQILELN